MSKIDDRTTVPFYWFVSALVFAVGGSWVTAMTWSGVKTDIHDMKKDIKLLKAKAGIADDSVDDASSSFLINDAKAGVKTDDVCK